jgi:hypothetical protein
MSRSSFCPIWLISPNVAALQKQLSINQIRFIVGEQYRSEDVSRSELALRPLGQCAEVLCKGGGTFTEAIPAAVAA